MKSILYRQFGSPDVLELAEVPRPTAGRGQVVVALRATSLNPIDYRVRRGTMWPLASKSLPKVPGADVAGVVAAIGNGVTGWRVGDEVVGCTNALVGGAFAEYVVLPAGSLVRKPASLSFEAAATLPITGVAALASIRSLGRVQAGQQILIHGGSGAVGLFAIQLAKHQQAVVTAVAGPKGQDRMREVGADRVIDYRQTPEEAFDRQYDVIINASGQLPFEKGRQYLQPRGRLIEPAPSIPLVIGSALRNLFRGQKNIMLLAVPRAQDLTELVGMLADGRLQTTIAKTYPLSEARAASHEFERGGTVGKIVLTSHATIE